MDNMPVFLYLSVSTLSFFSFLAVASWSVSSRREREAFYRNEALKRISESSIEKASAASDFLRQEDLRQQKRRQENLKVAGLVLVAVGLGLMIFLYIMGERPEFMSGSMPLIIGLFLVGYTYLPAGRS